MKISLIVPVLNEKNQLLTLLEDLSEQTHPPDEVLFIDGGSTDGSTQLIDEWKGLVPQSIVQLQGSSIPQARNYGISIATHSYILFTDVGCRLPKDWVESHRSMLLSAESKNSIVYAPVQPTSLTRFQVISGSFLVPSIRYQTTTGLPTTRSVLIPKSVIKIVGLFDTNLKVSEDHEWMIRAKKHNIHFAPVKSGVVLWSSPNSMDELIYKFARYAFYDGLTKQRPGLLLSYAIRYMLLYMCLKFPIYAAILLIGAYLLRSLVKVGLWKKLKTKPVELLGAAGIKLLIDLVVPLSYITGYLFRYILAIFNWIQRGLL